MAQATYQIDLTHSSVHFSVRHMMLSNVRGEFTKFSGSATVDLENPANSFLEATIESASISTRDSNRDTHLKSADFLEVDKFPTITFRSKQIEMRNGSALVHGELTIHGVTRPVTLDVEGPTEEVRDPWGKQRVAASATATLNRKDFGLTYNAALETGGVLVGEEVKVVIDVEAVRV